jgi:hypothetical protein
LIYIFEQLIPHETTKDEPLKIDLKLCYGIIHRVEFFFPPGPVGLAGVAVFDAIHQVWPTNTGAWITSDDETISYREHLPLFYEPFSLQGFFYNEDDTYDHTITIRIGILPPEVIAPWLMSYENKLISILGGE